MAKKWFEETFLASLVERAKSNAPKYRDRVILSQKQVDVCYRNMTPKKCYGDYGEFTILTHETSTHKFQLTESGRYAFLYIYQK